jgi:hypothetical protein
MLPPIQHPPLGTPPPPLPPTPGAPLCPRCGYASVWHANVRQWGCNECQLMLPMIQYLVLPSTATGRPAVVTAMIKIVISVVLIAITVAIVVATHK